MDMIGYMAEIVLVAFILGGFLGAVIAIHLSKSHARDGRVHHGEAVAVKVRAKR